MSTEEREDPRERRQPPPSVSMSELLASCAAAHAVSTPPHDPPSAPASATPARPRQQDRDAA